MCLCFALREQGISEIVTGNGRLISEIPNLNLDELQWVFRLNHLLCSCHQLQRNSAGEKRVWDQYISIDATMRLMHIAVLDSFSRINNREAFGGDSVRWTHVISNM